MVALIRRVHVVVRVWIQDKIRRGEAGDMRTVVVADGVGIHQLAGVVRIVPCLLQPDGEEVVIEPAINELGVSSCTLLALLHWIYVE